MRLVMPLIIGSLLLASCGLPRPDTTISIVNARSLKMSGYNLKDDYDSSGNLKPGVQPRVKQLRDLNDLDKHAVTDPQGLANLKAYIKAVREEYQNCQMQLQQVLR